MGGRTFAYVTKCLAYRLMVMEFLMEDVLDSKVEGKPPHLPFTCNLHAPHLDVIPLGGGIFASLHS